MFSDDAVISMQKTGGFAGVSQLFQQKFTDLDGDERYKLESLLVDCQLADVTDVTDTNQHARDVLYFVFKLAESGKVHIARFDTLTLPDTYKRLSDWLQDRWQAEP